MDHELDAASVRQLASHLHQCAECRVVLDDFQSLNDMVRGLPKIDLGSDFAAHMIRKLNATAAAVEIERRVGLSLFERFSRIAEDFIELVSSVRSPPTGTLDEFSDFPPLSMGYIYFKLMSVSR
jgi:hypothetical protein